jgi:hypothetical protein
LSRQSITDPSTYTKIVTSQGREFAYSFEPRTENPRVEISVIMPVNMQSEDSDLIEEFFMNGGLVLRGYSCLF